MTLGSPCGSKTHCYQCGIHPVPKSSDSNIWWCRKCTQEMWKIPKQRVFQRENKHFRDAWARKAHMAVSVAVRNGKLASLKEAHVLCVDCGKKATCWEHRNYAKPLKVDPTCQVCNRRRGHAKFPLCMPPSHKRIAKGATP